MEEKNRRHRKSAVETMSKEELTSEISARWKNLDEETLGYVKRLSAVEKKRVESLLAEMDRDGEREEGKEDKEFIKLKTLKKRAVSKMMDPVKIGTSQSEAAAPASRATSKESSSGVSDSRQIKHHLSTRRHGDAQDMSLANLNALTNQDSFVESSSNPSIKRSGAPAKRSSKRDRRPVRTLDEVWIAEQQQEQQKQMKMLSSSEPVDEIDGSRRRSHSRFMRQCVVVVVVVGEESVGRWSVWSVW